MESAKVKASVVLRGRESPMRLQGPLKNVGIDVTLTLLPLTRINCYKKHAHGNQINR